MGIGRSLLEECDRVAKDKEIMLLWANGREPAVEFYKRMGWAVVFERFEIPTAGPHFKMIRRLGDSPMTTIP
jgi:GNAT superfamily N-acetyltransferase